MKKQVVHVMLLVLLLCAPVLSQKWRSTAEPSSSISRAAITRPVGMLP